MATLNFFQNEACSNKFIHSQVLVEQLLCARHSARCSGNNCSLFLFFGSSIRASYEVEDGYVGNLSLGTGLASVGLDSDNTLENSPLFW